MNLIPLLMGSEGNIAVAFDVFMSTSTYGQPGVLWLAALASLMDVIPCEVEQYEEK